MGAPATQPDVCPALSDLYHAQYRSLFRLAVLLTGDADAAEAVVLDSFSASQREAIVLTFYLDLSPEQAAAACRVTLATPRRRLAEARSALRAVLPSNP